MSEWKATDTNGYANTKPKWIQVGNGQGGIESARANAQLANTVLVTSSRKANANTSAITSAYGQRGISHTGWVTFKTGTGGRAGRVTSEVLVALSSPVGTGNNANPFFTGV
jgi:tRNA U34 5-carboxymethylaminomethyl modifying enzyme MnmG/GidA